MKKLACLSILAFSFLSLASAAKSYQITLADNTKVGKLQLAAGDYIVKVQGSNALFTNQNTAKTFTAPVKIENVSQKFDETAVDVNTAGGQNIVQDIQLGGTTTKLDFGY